jgi:hypothetical protein
MLMFFSCDSTIRRSSTIIAIAIDIVVVSFIARSFYNR